MALYPDGHFTLHAMIQLQQRMHPAAKILWHVLSYFSKNTILMKNYFYLVSGEKKYGIYH
tara:strand:+ start:104 stop:283 length:180 start_codon:yes stop_codon:yes gene_type:complete